jgi:hypothetical protein
MNREQMTEKLIGAMITRIIAELKENNAESLYSILKMMLDDLSLREFIDSYNEYEWEEV